MKNVSNAYKKVIEQGGPFYLRAKVAFTDGTILELTPERDFQIDGNGIVQDGGSGFPLGVAVSKTLTIALDNSDDRYSNYDFVNARITPKTEAYTEDGTEWIQEEIFTVLDPVEIGDTIELTAYDDMYKADRAFTSKLDYPVTVKQLLLEVCDACDIPVGSPTFKNETYQIQTKPEGKTARQIIGYIAQIACGNAVMQSGTLVIRSYDFGAFQTVTDGIKESELQDNAGYYIVSDYPSEPNISTDNITITGISTKIRQENEDVTLVQGSDEYCLEIENPLIEGNEKTALALIGKTLIGTTICKFSGSFFSDPTMEFMDLVCLVDMKDHVRRSFLSNVEFVYLNQSNLSCNLETPAQRQAQYNSNATTIYQNVKRDLQQNKTEWETAVDNLGAALENASGMYQTEVVQDDGSIVTYIHDKKTLSQSKNVIKVTSEAIGLSSDGGKTFPYGLYLTGDLITRILYTIGINANYINTGAFTVKDTEGNINFQADTQTGKVIISGNSVMIGGKTATDAINSANSTASNALTAAQNARNMTLQLSNDYYSVNVDSNGKYSKFPTDVTTKAQVMYGANDITSECAFSITKSDNIVGTWDSAKHQYTVTALTADTGWVNIQAKYLSKLTVTKQFTVAKLYAGANGLNGKDGVDGKDGATGAKGEPGTAGANGKSIGSVINYYLATASAGGVTTATAGWTTEVQNVSLQKKYLWNYEVIKYTDGTTASTTKPCIIGSYGDTGQPGKDGAKGADGDNFSWNIIKGSAMTNGTRLVCSGIAVMNSVSSYGYENDGYHIVTPSAGNNNNGVGFVFNDFSTLGIKPGNVLTFSCDVKGTSDNNTPFIQLHFQASGTQWYDAGHLESSRGNFTPTTDFKRVSVTYTLPDKDVYKSKRMWLAIHGNYASNLYIRNIKLELGSPATPWTPHPDDLKGAKGETGANGKDGINGKDGVSPTVSVSKSGNTTTITITDKTGTHTQTVKDGANGTPGKDGTNGKTTYFHVKYSNDGGKTFTANSGETVGSYIGTCTDYTEADPTTVGAYTWVKIKGEPGKVGAKGATGNGILAIKEHYAVSTSNTTAPTTWYDAAQTTTATKKYLWNYETITYTNGTSVDTKKRVIGVYGDKGATGEKGTPGRTYFIELSSRVLKRSKDNTIAPDSFTIKGFYRDGNSTTRVAYNGRFTIEETNDGNTWKRVYTSSADESSVTHSLYTAIATGSGKNSVVGDGKGNAIGFPRDTIAVRCTMYASGGTTTTLDVQDCAILVDVDALTQEEIFNALTNNGEVKGIYKEGNQLYISFTYAKGGALTLGGKGNGNGLLKIFDDRSAITAMMNNEGLCFGSFLDSSEGRTELPTFDSNAVKMLIKNGIFQSEDPHFYGKIYMNRLGNTKYQYHEDYPMFKDTSQTTGRASLLIGVDPSDKADCEKYGLLKTFSVTAGEIVIRAREGDSNNGHVWIYGQTRADSIDCGGSITAGSAKIRNTLETYQLNTTGSKKRVVQTEDYGRRSLYCYEMPTPMFGDIGEAITDEYGLCYVYIDDIFEKTVNTEIEYQVFLQKEGEGDVWVEKKEKTHFIVKGTPNLKFSWELKIKQRDFELERLELSNPDEKEFDDIDYETQGQNIFKEYLRESEEL